jgi:predicted acylesterase/phospholipase RssA
MSASASLRYFVGVATVMRQNGLWLPGKTAVAGSSAGSLIAAAVQSGLDDETILQSMLSLPSRADCPLGLPTLINAFCNQVLLIWLRI